MQPVEVTGQIGSWLTGWSDDPLERLDHQLMA